MYKIFGMCSIRTSLLLFHIDVNTPFTEQAKCKKTTTGVFLCSILFRFYNLCDLEVISWFVIAQHT